MKDNIINRFGFIEQLNDALKQLREESVGLVGRLPTLKKSFDEAEEIIRGFIKDLEELPRICVVGSTGMGKSTLINHIIDFPIAATDAVFSKTQYAHSYFYPQNEPVCEIVDTRGLNEVFNQVAAEKQLIEELASRRPHLIIFVADAAGRAGLDRELTFLKQLLDHCSGLFRREVGCLIIANRCDGITPAGFASLPEHEWQKTHANDNPRIVEKRKNISEKLALIKKVVADTGFRRAPEVLPAAMMWQPEKKFWNREAVMAEVFSQSPTNVLFAFGQLDQMSANINKTLELIAQEIIIKFSIVSATVCWNPFPVPDAFVLMPLQVAMINAIKAMKMTGDLDAIGIMKIVGLASQAGKMTANAILKILPGVGQAINATIAATVTYGLGKIAIAHYIYGWGPDKLAALADFAQFREEVEKLLAGRLKK